MEHRPEYPKEPISGEIRSTEVFIPDVPPGQGKVCNVRLRGECHGGSHGGHTHRISILSTREDLCITLYPDALEKLIAELQAHLTACRKWEDSLELLPCPFCGAKARVVKLERIWIQCTNCGARGTAEPLHTISAAAVAARSWNRRSLKAQEETPTEETLAVAIESSVPSAVPAAIDMPVIRSLGTDWHVNDARCFCSKCNPAMAAMTTEAAEL